MNIYICENIKRLRREKNITQEKLAEHLNISYQAVSKWERGETYPDITLVIPLATYFGVTTDELLGLDAAKNEAKIQEYLTERGNLQICGKWEEETELSIKAHKEFPNDFRITCWYMRTTVNRADTPADVILSRADEFTDLCESILGECTIDRLRAEAAHILAQINRAKGNIDKAFELLDRFPDWYSTKNQLREQLFDKKSDEWWDCITANFLGLADFAHDKLLKMIWHSDKTFGEKVDISLRVADYLVQILDETNYELLYNAIALTYNEIGKQHHIAGKREDAIKYWDIGLGYAQKFDNFLASERQIPFASAKSKRNLTELWESSGEWNTMVKRQLAWYENNPWFGELQKLDSFTAMLEKYRQK